MSSVRSCYSCRRSYSGDLVRDFDAHLAGSIRSAALCYRCALNLAQGGHLRGPAAPQAAGLADLCLTALSVDPTDPESSAADLDLYRLACVQMRAQDGEVRRRFVAALLAAGRDGEAA